MKFISVYEKILPLINPDTMLATDLSSDKYSMIGTNPNNCSIIFKIDIDNVQLIHKIIPMNLDDSINNDIIIKNNLLDFLTKKYPLMSNFDHIHGLISCNICNNLQDICKKIISKIDKESHQNETDNYDIVFNKESTISSIKSILLGISMKNFDNKCLITLEEYYNLTLKSFIKKKAIYCSTKFLIMMIKKILFQIVCITQIIYSDTDIKLRCNLNLGNILLETNNNDNNCKTEPIIFSIEDNDYVCENSYYYVKITQIQHIDYDYDWVDDLVNLLLDIQCTSKFISDNDFNQYILNLIFEIKKYNRNDKMSIIKIFQ